MAGSSLLTTPRTLRVGGFFAFLLSLLLPLTLSAADPQTATGYQHSAYLAADGTVWAWGDNSYGQLGQGNFTPLTGPVRVPGLNNIIEISTGFYHTLALTSNGQVYAWGYNYDAELGQGAVGTVSTTPVLVPGLVGIKSVSAGGYFSLALGANGTGYAWGRNSSGECSTGSTGSPVVSPTAFGGVWRKLAGGGLHGLGIGVDGNAYAWGNNTYGQVGNGTSGGSVTPFVAVTGMSNVVSIAGGCFHSLCSLADGTVRLWGNDNLGQCANGSTTGNVTTPYTPPGYGYVGRVTAGYNTSYLWTIYGAVYAAGDNGYGQCLAATSTASYPSMQFIGYIYARWNACLGGLGNSQSAVGADGVVMAWGSNGNGQVGYNSGGVSVTTLTTVNGGWNNDRIIAVAAGNAHTMALKADGTLWTWGSDGYGRLGDDATIADKNTPVQVPIDHVVAIAAGSYHCLAIDIYGRLWSWGWDSSYGQLGNDAALADQPTPVLVGYYYRAIAGGAYHSLAVAYNGAVWAWGGDNSLQLGDDTVYANKPTPVQVAGLSNVLSVDAGYSTSCALRADGRAFYWGLNNFGQGANGSTGTITAATQILSGDGLSFATVVQAGQYHAGGLDGNGFAYGWGYDNSGQVGSNQGADPVITNKSTPSRMVSLTNRMKSLSIGGDYADFTAMISGDGKVFAVGSDSYGQLGDGAPQATQSTPVLTDGSGTAFAVAGGDYHLVILYADGTVKATGNDGNGQLGNGANSPVSTPTPTTPTWLPTVTLTVIQANGYETSSDPVIIRFSRTNGTSGALQVNYTWSGSSGLTAADFLGGVPPSGTITIPNGASYVDLSLRPEDDNEDEGDDALSPERVDITLTANPALYIGGGQTVSGYFYDNDQAKILVVGTGPVIETAIIYSGVTVAGTTLTCGGAADLSLIRPGMQVYFTGGANAGQARYVQSSDNASHQIILQAGGLSDGSGNTISVGGLAAIMVSLQTRPTANVTVSAISSNTAEGVLPASSVTLGPVAGTATGSISFTANPVDGNQVTLNDGATIKTFEFDNNSSVSAGAIAVAIGGGVVISRDNLIAAINGVSPTLTITASVASLAVIGLTADATGSMNTAVTTSGAALVGAGMSGGVTAWNSTAMLWIAPVNDDVDDGDATYTITTNPATSADPYYNGLNPPDISQTTIDDDTAGFIITSSNVPLLESGRTYAGVVATGNTLTFPSGTDMTVLRSKMLLLIGGVARSIVSVNGGALTVLYNGAAVGDATYAVRVGYQSYFTARLTSKPQSTVSVGLTSSNTAEGVPQASTITFDSTNWNQDRTFVVTPIDDDVDDGDKVFTIVTAAAVSSDLKYSGLNPADATFLSVDDDTAAVVLSKTAADVSESGGNDTYTIVLASQPTANVTVTLATSPAGQITTDVSSVLFTPSDWKNPKTVTITAVNDDFIESPHPNAQITHAVTSSDTSYAGMAVPDISPVVVHDNDTPGITVTPTSGLVTSESGAIASATVVLTSNPTANLAIDFASDAVDEIAITTSLLTAQTVTAATRTIDFAVGTDLSGVTAGMRVRVVGSSNNVYSTVSSVGATSVVLSAVSLDGSTLADATGESVAFLPPQWSFVSTATSGHTISFAGGTDLSAVQVGMAVQFAVGGPHAGLRRAVTAVDDSAKTIDVDGAVLSAGTDTVLIGGLTLTFTSVTYNQPQTIYLVGIDDPVNDHDQPVRIISSPTRCPGFATYDQQTVADISATNLDDDQAGVRVVASGGSNDVAESGGTDSFTIRLNSLPTQSVTVVLSTTDGQTTVSPSVLFFSTTTYATPQTVTITAVNDDIDEADIHDGVITLQGYSSDPAYNIAFPAVTVHVTDDDTAGIVVSPTSGLVTTEAGGTATVSVSLSSRPTVPVILTFSNGSPNEAKIDTDSTTAGYQNQLTINPATWNSPHLVQVIGQPDALDDGDQPFQITITSVSAVGDANYDNRVVPPLTGTNVDDDTRGVQLSLINGTVTEAAGASHHTSYTIVLTAQPTSDVTVQVNPDAQVTVDHASLTFSDTTWSTPQTITVTAVDDQVAEAATHAGVVSHTVTGGGYDGIAIQDFTALITDNDNAGIAGDLVGNPLSLHGTPREAGHGSASNLTCQTVTGATRTVHFASGTDLSAVFVGQTVRFLGASTANNGTEATVQSVNDGADTLVVDAAVSDASGETVEFFAGIPVVLTSQPTANVEITFGSSDTSEGFLRFPTLVFTPETWNQPQIMTVIGADDAVADGAVPYQIQITKVRSNDPNYDALAVSPLAATTIDDDTAGYAYVRAHTPLLTTEGGGTDTFTVALKSQPTADVTIPISSSNALQGSVSVSSLTFTPANWNAPRSVTVTGLDGDGVDNGATGVAYTIVIGLPTISNGSDPTYAAINPPNLSANNQSVNSPPKLDVISDVLLSEDAAAKVVAVTGINDGQVGENQTLTITAVSNNHTLLADPTVSALTGTAPNQTLNLTFQPLAQQSGSATVTVTVDDGATTTQRSFTVTVLSVNDAPTLHSISDLALNEDAPAQVVALTSIGTGATNELQTLTITAVSDRTDIIPNPTVTYVAGAATGQLDFTPVAEASGTATITVTIQDDGGTLNGGIDTRVRIFHVVVAAVNDQPTLDPLSNVVLNEDAGPQSVALTGISSGAVNEIQTLTVTAVSDNPTLFSNLAVTYVSPATTGSLQFTPTANASGTATITVTLSDGGSGTATRVRTFQVQINAVNDPPQIDAIADVVLLEDAATTNVTMSGINDGQAGENQTLTITAVSSNHALLPDPVITALTGTAPNQSAKLRIKPVAQMSGSATITVTVDDGQDTTQRVFTVTVTPVNDAPTLNALSDLALNEDAGIQHVTLSGIGSGAANETQVLTITATSDRTDIVPTPVVTYNAGASVGQLDFTPVADASGTATITVTIQDDGGTLNGGIDTQIQTFQVVIAPVNDPPTLNALTNLVLSEDAGVQTIVLDGISSGAANETQTLTVSAVSDNLTLIPNLTASYTSPSATGSLQFTPLADSAGVAHVTVTVSDGGSGTSTVTRTFRVLVNPVNDAPVPTTSAPATRKVVIGGSRAITAGDLSATDVDGGVAPPTPDPALVFTVALPPGGGVLQRDGVTLNANDTFTMQDISDGLLNYVHGGGSGATDGFAFTVTDLGIAAGSVLASPLLPASDLAPASSAPQVFSITIDRRPPLVQLLGTAPVFTEGQPGTTLVADAAIVTDADSSTFNGGTIRATVSGATVYTLTLHNQGTGTDQVSLSGTTVRLNGLDIGTLSGGDSSPLLIACTSNMTPVAAQLVLRDLEFISPGDNPQAGSALVAVQITDDHGDQSTVASQSVTVVPVNDAPLASSPLLVTVANQTLFGVITVTDPDNTVFTFNVTQAPAKGGLSAIAADGSFTYTPAHDQSGNDQFTVVVNDGTVDSAPCVVQVRISGSGTGARPWFISDPPLEVQEGSLLRFTAQVSTAGLASGAAVTFSLVGAPSGMALVQSATDAATVTWTAVLGSGNHVAFRVRATEPVSGATSDLPVLLYIHPLTGGGG